MTGKNRSNNQLDDPSATHASASFCLFHATSAAVGSYGAARPAFRFDPACWVGSRGVNIAGSGRDAVLHRQSTFRQRGAACLGDFTASRPLTWTCPSSFPGATARQFTPVHASIGMTPTQGPTLSPLKRRLLALWNRRIDPCHRTLPEGDSVIVLHNGEVGRGRLGSSFPWTISEANSISRSKAGNPTNTIKATQGRFEN
jgi:hypothetical protein